MIDVRISPKPLNVTNCIKKVMSPTCGGIGLFIGTIRSSTDSQLLRLEYEVYTNMALKEMKKIATATVDKWPVENVAIHHRSGVLGIGEIAVVIATSAPHREAALEACHYAIDTLKKTVPVWKKEVFEDREDWVQTHL